MSKKYLSIEEAAEMLGMDTSELNRLRERGEVRAFADRGTWKFKAEDVEKLQRTRQADSDPDVPLQNFSLDDDDSSELVLGDEEELSEQPTIIRRGQDDGNSDSDVRLFFDDSMRVDDAPLVPLSDSDSDVRLASEKSASASDSDVRLVGETVSDVRLGGGSGSDSDVKLVSGSGVLKKKPNRDSDSNVRLAGAGQGNEDTIELSSDSVLDDGDSGVTLAGGSGISLASESGISLDKINDSGISLDADSGISLDDDRTASFSLDSGIGLSMESGIALGGSGKMSGKASGKAGKGSRKDQDDDLGATIPMMETPLDGDDDLLDTSMEAPLADDGDSDFDIPFQSDDSSVITLDDESEVDDYSATMVKKKGAVEEDDEEEDLFGSGDTIAGDDEEELEVADDVLGEDDALEELDAFGADDEDFAESESGSSSVDMQPAYMPRGIQAPVEQEWGAGTLAGVGLSTVLMIACGVMMLDLVRNMWHTDLQRQNPISSMLLDTFRDLF